MEAHGLMIGNAYLEKNSGEIIIVEAISVEGESEIITFSGDFKDEWQAIPIEINETVLLKAGFEKYDHVHDDKSVTKGAFRKDRFRLSESKMKHLSARFFISITQVAQPWNSQYLTSIDYFHELQNMYFLIEKKPLKITA